MSQKTLSRRSFVVSAALGSAALATGAQVALASSAKGDAQEWDASYDVVVAGMGFAGMVTAMSAADEGASVLLVEKLAEGPAGGNSRVCGQMFLYGNGDVEATKAYLTSLMGSREVPGDILDVYAKGSAGLTQDLA